MPWYVVKHLNLEGIVKDLPRVGVEIYTKFGGCWSGGSRVKEGHRYIIYVGNVGIYVPTVCFI